jgi:hypothetical protein
MRFLAVLLAASLALACDHGVVTPDRELELAAVLDGEVPASRVLVEVQGADLGAPRQLELTPDGAQWRAVLGGLPGGAPLSVRAWALDAGGGTVGEATVPDLPLGAGADGALLLTLVAPAAPATAAVTAKPQPNRPPVILAILTTPLTVQTGGSVTMLARAIDPDSGDTARLQYRWTATAGTFTSPSSPLTSWRAPSTPGDVTVTLRVTDPKGAFDTASFVIRVVARPGSVRVTVFFNKWPQVTAMTVDDGQVPVGQPVRLTALGSDPDRDPLTWLWSATCAGTFTPATGTSTTFVPAAPAPAGGACTVMATAADGRGGTGTGRLGIWVTSLPVPAYAPVFGLTFQGADAAAPGEEVPFEVAATSPGGLPLAFSWQASTGAVTPAAPSPGLDSAILWTAACAPGGLASVVATASDGTTSSRRVFSVAVPACP